MEKYISCKTEIDPTEKQKRIIEKNFEACRKIFNLYLQRALTQYDHSDKYDDEVEFLDWFYKVYMRNWKMSFDFPRGFNGIALKKICRNVKQVMEEYSHGHIGRPINKNEKYGRVTIYFRRDRRRMEDIVCERHRVFIPGFGWIRIKEKGYFPVQNQNRYIISGFISKRAGRYFVSVNIKADDDCCAFASRTSQGEPIGIDLGIGKFAVLSDGRSFENINKQKRIKLLEKRVDRLQRSLSRKEKDEADKNSGRSKNYDQTKFQLEQTYYRLHNIRSDFINKAVKKIVETNPRYIAIEDLKITEMVQERMFSRSISLQMFYEFRKRLIRKCLNDGIEIRVVDRWYPSSKRCHNCGRVKNRLLHSERVYECECGYKADRDFNASLNIRDAEKYHRVTVYP